MMFMCRVHVGETESAVRFTVMSFFTESASNLAKSLPSALLPKYSHDERAPAVRTNNVAAINGRNILRIIFLI